MRFGLATDQEHTSWDAVRSIWESADEIPLWESAWTGDHFYPFLGDPSGPCLEGWVSVTALAMCTARLRVGVLVSGMPHRHPAVLAKMAATLDHASGGRLNLGLGAAWNEQECAAYGIDLGAVGPRLHRFAEGVEVVARLLSEATTTFAGQHYALRDARCEPKPIQRPRPPITIGGTGERGTLPVVARWADHWDLGFTAPSAVRHKLDLLADRCAELGRDATEVTISAVVLTAGRTSAEIHDHVAEYEAVGCDLALLQARAESPEGARDEIDRLTEICASLAA